MTASWPRSCPGIPFQLAGVFWKSVNIGGFPSAEFLALSQLNGLWFENGKVLVMTEFAFTSTITQNTSEITCVFIRQKAESSGAPETSVSSKISNILEDLGCYLNSQGTENTYKTIRNVEVNLFEDFELRIIMSISNIVSCFWFLKERKACKLSLDSENRYIASLAFSQTKEGQAGKYTLLVTSETSNYTVVVPVLIRKKPAKPYFRKREKSDSIECISESYPQPSLEWIFCKTPEKRAALDRFIPQPAFIPEVALIHVQHHALGFVQPHEFSMGPFLELFQVPLDVIPSFWCAKCSTQHGVLCKLANDLNERQEAPLPELLIKAGEPLLIRCRAVHHNYKFEIKLSSENREVDQDHQFRGLDYQSNYSAIRIQYAFTSAAGRSDSGQYTCSSTAHPNQTALVTVLEKGFINVTDSKEDFEIGEEEFCFEVNFTAYPPVRCIWLFSQKAFPCKQSYSVDGHSISSKFCNHQHQSGIYIFYAENDDMVVTKKFTLYVRSCFFSKTYSTVCFCLPKQLRYESQLQMIQMIRPSDNEYIYIDFREFEYDLKWEFPRENLEFGQVLGSGAFGKVVNATAYGISNAGDSVQVAVKMLKEKPDASEEDALMSELKMMTHIGSHENIVNLLGACTVSGPIYLIFEYCCYGDLLNYLRSKREKFHWTLTDIFKQHNFSFYHNINLDQNSRMGTHLKYSVNTTLCREDEFEITQRSQKINVTPESNGIVLFSEEDKIKDASTQMEEEEDFNVLTFEDLLCFSYQVAKGMEFLESKSCIHRDLAARNILVTHGKVVKICDFGLARDVMNDPNYIVRGNARLPVKWMAPESLFERTYTMKSDVWSYGILLWEIFSLGVNPYPGIQVDTNFYKLIQNGFKMDQPYYATKEIYCMMQSCWALDSRKRPSFSYLVSSLACQLVEAEGAVYQNVKQNAATHHCSIETKPCVSRDEESLLFPIMLQHEDAHVEK
ncbi:receptor-type tyrosine-protein kinase FLT3 [Willisornis vidua]|uniref:receptor protein-tyrosine kinase n=1 Tax=Willisornis vidua TaxID=1566151 RepID=A0ABQ9CXM6_9PASS|nr:receptor-type tyrosine-protein kinase FLT3 [Willisornis vidua]